MKEMVDKLVALERRVSTTRGPFALFALFLREDSPDKWDLIVSAKWIQRDEHEALSYWAKEVRKTFSTDEMMALSRIVIVDESHPDLQEINDTLAVEHGRSEVTDANFFGLQIKRAFIITSKKAEQLQSI